MRIKFQGTFQIIDDAENVETIQLPAISKSLEITDLSEKDVREIDIAAGASDVALGLGNVNSPKALIIIAMVQGVTYKLNSTGATATSIAATKKTDTEKKYGMLFLTTDTSITEIYFGNSGSVAAKIKVIIVS